MPEATITEYPGLGLISEILHGSPVPTFVIDSQHRVTHWNRACEVVLGWPAAALVGTRDQWKPFYPSERPVMADLVLSGAIDASIDAYYGGKYRRSEIVPGSYEAEDYFPQMGANGTWLYFLAAPLLAADGSVVGAVETLQDITERKRLAETQAQAQRELRTERDRLATVIEHFPCGISLVDADLKVVGYNAEFRRMLGFPADLFAGGNPVPLEAFLRFNAGRGEYGDAAAAEAYIARILAAATEFKPHCFERTRPDGTVLEIRGSPLPNGGLITSYTDITDRKRAEAQIHALLDRQQQIFDNAHAGIILLKDRQIIVCNQRTAELFGYPDAAAMTGMSTRCFYGDEAAWQADGRVLYERLRDQGYSDDEVQYCRRNGETFWCHRTGRPLDPAAPYDGSIWVFSDMTEKRRQDEQLRLSNTVFDNSSEALMITDRENRIVSVNKAFTTVTGFAAADVLGRDPSLLKSGRHDVAFFAAMWQALRERGIWQGEIWDRRKNGDIYPKWLSIAVVRDAQGEICNYVAAFSDITERKAAESRIQFLAHHDSLTALPNRVLLRDRYDHAVGAAKRGRQLIGVLFLDLDHFKRINDTHGHRVGDLLLIGVAHRVKGLLRESDTLSRLGGDEFIILLEEQDALEQISRVAEKILAALDIPFEIETQSFHTSCSIGIAVYPHDGTEFDVLLQKADTAMYAAKAAGRNAFSFFDERMNADAAARLKLHSDMRRALHKNEFRLAYQPQYALRDSRLCGVETLLRWSGADGSPICPGQFIPIAEENGLIIPLGQWVMHEACVQARKWLDQGMALRTAINVSGVQIYRSDLPRILREVLHDTGVPPALIEVEFTESTLMADTEVFQDVIAALKGLGVSVAIDDFGTGYSSLSYLKRFRVDRLKIDRSFVTDIPGDDDDKAIVRAVIGLARSLKLETIAEGVETMQQMKFLRAHGCHVAQGFLLGRPMAVEGIGALIRT
jgi:diguanylate cyclase (GGDEF)-like protein/PAS domain S-box-containing protein